MSNYQIEKEYKMMLEEDDFSNIINHINFDEIVSQDNHYYTASKNMGMRIRYVHDKYYFTLKHKINDEVREYEWEIDDNNINDPSILKLLNELNIDEPKYLGTLSTIRYQKDYPLGILCLDKNIYLDHLDYELEYELKDANNDDFITLENILKEFKLEFIPNHISKYGRFINALKK